ncbi:MAG: hypothetical protein HY751_10330 [Nitrospinae bacterium]|nr:hypothetical protein [Nitrospinota bacterium]
MTLDELWKYAYVKRPLTEIYSSVDDVPFEFKMEWLKDAYDYKRTYSDEEIASRPNLTPEQVLDWLEEVVPLIWEAKMAELGIKSPN